MAKIRQILMLILCIYILGLIGCTKEVVEEKEVIEEEQKEPEPEVQEEVVKKEPVEEAMPEKEVKEEVEVEEEKEEKEEEKEEVRTKTIEGDVLSRTKTTEEIVIRDVICNPDKGKLHFEIYNPTDRSLDPRVGGVFEDPEGLMRISVNGRRFPEECDKDELKSKESMECDASFNPNDPYTKLVLRVGTDELGFPHHNRLIVKASGINSEVRFKCIA